MKAGVLIVGNFFVSERGGRAVCEDLSERLERSGWRVSTTSWQASRPLRLLDMIATTWQERRRFEIACVDVFSDAAFVWAEAVCLTLRLAAKPYMLALRGGNLPVFAAAHPRRVRRLLQSARCVIAPSAYLRDAMRPYRGDLVLQPNPIDLAAYPFRLRDRPRPHLVWIRAFHRIYNPALAVAVLARVVREYPEATPEHDRSGQGGRNARRDDGVRRRMPASRIGSISRDLCRRATWAAGCREPTSFSTRRTSTTPR